MHFLYPLGLISLASLAGVLFLYFYVFRGRRLEVSELFLWGQGQSLRDQGQRLRRPPVTWPLVLELLAALLLALLVAGLVYSRLAERRHAVVVLDSSASMSAGSGPERTRAKVRAVFRMLGRSGRVSLVRSGGGVELIGGKPLDAAQAEAELRNWAPADPPHAVRAAIELGKSLMKETEKVVLVTDHKAEEQDAIVLGVGAPLQNSGWVAAHWMGPRRLFALARHFGSQGTKKTVVLLGGVGNQPPRTELGRVPVDFSTRRAVPLVFNVPDHISSVAAVLPDDALANDNVLRLARPPRLAIATRLDLGHKLLEEQFVRALSATGKIRISKGPGAMLEVTRLPAAGTPPAAAAAAFSVQCHLVPADQATPYVGPFFIDHFAGGGLTRGLDLHGVIWGADPRVKARGKLLLSVGDVPLLCLDAAESAAPRLLLNIAPERSNLFRTPAWPVLVSNIVDTVYARSPGLKRFSYRLGETLSFYRPDAWKGTVAVVGPDGRRTEFDGDSILYGRLERDGFYRVFAGDTLAARLDVNLLAQAESDLTKAETFGDLRQVKAALLPETHLRLFHREFAAAAAALLITCWFLLERRTT